MKLVKFIPGALIPYLSCYFCKNIDPYTDGIWVFEMKGEVHNWEGSIPICSHCLMELYQLLKTPVDNLDECQFALMVAKASQRGITDGKENK